MLEEEFPKASIDGLRNFIPSLRPMKKHQVANPPHVRISGVAPEADWIQKRIGGVNNRILESICEAEHTLHSISCIEMEEQEEVLANTSESTRIKVAMDSAAVDHVIHPEELPQSVEHAPNTTGKHFAGANNAHIEKFGSCQTRCTSKHGDVGCDWCLADVTRPLHSVAKV